MTSKSHRNLHRRYMLVQKNGPRITRLSGRKPDITPGPGKEWMRGSSERHDGLHRFQQEPMTEEQGTETLLFRSKRRSHVVQGTAAPAREPCPVVVDVIAGAVTPACVEQPVPVTTAGFSAFGFVFFGA